MWHIIRLTLVCFLLLAALGLARAQLQLLGSGSNQPGGGGPGACSNELDFSVACNSQYVSVLGIP